MVGYLVFFISGFIFGFIVLSMLKCFNKDNDLLERDYFIYLLFNIIVSISRCNSINEVYGIINRNFHDVEKDYSECEYIKKWVK